MAASLVSSTFTGARVAVKSRASSKSARVSTQTTAMAGNNKKVFSYDDDWVKGLGSVGLFLEDKEARSVNVLERVQKKKILSSVEKSGVLSFLEKNGVTLSKVESLGLLSKAESVGALSLLEKAATTNPATTASFALPCVVATILSLTLLPGDNLVVLKDVVAASFAVGAVTFLATGIIVSDLQED